MAMVREIATEIEIEASARHVWDALADFAAYPRWNPFLLKVHGAANAGERIRFWFELPRGLRAPACATVLKVERERELRWAGGTFRHSQSRALLRAGGASRTCEAAIPPRGNLQRIPRADRLAGTAPQRQGSVRGDEHRAQAPGGTTCPGLGVTPAPFNGVFVAGGGGDRRRPTASSAEQAIR